MKCRDTSLCQHPSTKLGAGSAGVRLCKTQPSPRNAGYWGLTLHPPNSVRTMRDGNARYVHIRLRARLQHLLSARIRCKFTHHCFQNQHEKRCRSIGNQVQWWTSAAPRGWKDRSLLWMRRSEEDGLHDQSPARLG